MSLLEQILLKKEDKKYFLTLCVEEHRFSAAVFSLSKNQVEIIGTGESEFSEDAQEIEAADLAISTAEKNLGENILIEKVIFGLPTTFIHGEKIKPEYLLRLKKISKELSLKPCGFIEHPQALSFFLEKKEESLPTLILVSAGKTRLTFSFIRIGKIESNFVIERTDSFISDFEKGLARFKSEILPSKIILYDEIRNQEHMDMLREELLSFPFLKHSSFLHTPKIETLPPSTLLSALVQTAGGSLIKEFHLDEEPEEVKPKDGKLEEIKPEADQKADTFGFVKGKDISLIKKTPEKETEAKVSEEHNRPEDFLQKRPDKKMAKLLSLFNLNNVSFPFPALSSFPFPVFTLLAVLFVLVFCLISLLWLYPKAALNLVVYPKTYNKQIEVVFSADSGKKAEENIIPAKTVSEEATGEKTMAVKGRKKIGEAARGEAALYNKTLESKTFPKGTILLHGDFRFTLDDEITVASASDTGEGLIFGKAAVKITAVMIGPESNLPGDIDLALKDFPSSSFYAKNKGGLTGGTSREVASVSTDDYDQLLLALTEELANKAKQQLAQKIVFPEKIIDSSIENKITSKKFSNEIGEEAKELSLTASLQTKGVVFNENDLVEFGKDSFSTPPPGYSLDKQKTQVKIETAQVGSNGEILVKATISSNFYPEIDLEKIKAQVTGKSYSDAAKYLSTVEHIGGIKIIEDSPLPFVKNKLPWNSNNITVTVSSN